MAADAPVANTAMEGGGYYNRNSNLQAAGIELGLPLLMEAARNVPAGGNAPFVIADYGSSQGRNSMRPMRLAIETLRSRIGADRAIEVVHTDLPSNDFTSLFTTLHEDQTSYLAGQTRIFPSAIGRSYFQPILPAGRVQLGWNSWTMHWLSCNPVEVDDQPMAIGSASAEARATTVRQQAQDWENFLAARAVEMADGGRLVTMAMGRTDEIHGWDWVVGELWRAALSMADDKLISPADLKRFTLPVAGRRTSDLQAPFANGSFHGLVLEHAEVREAPDPLWDEYLATGDAQQLGKRWAGMIRAVSSPCAMLAFGARPDCTALVDELYRRMENGIAATPQKNTHFLFIAAVRKKDT
jgi:hypothetical protein